MNVSVRIEARQPDVVTGNHYTLTADDLGEGYVDASNVFHGTNRWGDPVTVPLDVPICTGCDAPVPATGHCEDCNTIHADCIRLADVLAETPRGVWL